MTSQKFDAVYKYTTEYGEDHDSYANQHLEFDDGASFTIRIDKGHSEEADLPVDKNSDQAGTFTIDKDSHSLTHPPRNIHLKLSLQQQQQQPQHQQEQQNQQQEQHEQKGHQHQLYPSNHYGYDFQMKEKEQRITLGQQHSLQDPKTEKHSATVGNISEPILALLPTCLPPPSPHIPAAAEDQFHQDRYLHHRAIVATDSAVSLTGDEILASPCSAILQSRSATMCSTTSTMSSSSQQPRSRSGSLSAASLHSMGPRSTSLGATTLKAYDAQIPPIPAQHLQNQHQQEQRPIPAGRGIIVDNNNSIHPSSAQFISSNPPSPGKTGWEREGTPTTPTPHQHKGHVSYHQNSPSLFDFFRSRKQSIPKNSPYHVAAAAAAAATAAATGARPHPPPAATHLPLMRTPPMIAKSRMGHPHQYPSSAPPLLPLANRKQSLDLSVLSGYQTPPTFSHLHVINDHRHATTMPIHSNTNTVTTPSVSSTSSPLVLRNANPTHPPHPVTNTSVPTTASSLTHSAQSTLTKVAAAVVGATMGRRRPSVTADTLETGFGWSLKQRDPQVSQSSRLGLSPAQLKDHAKFLKEAKTAQDLSEYIEQLYHTVLNSNLALECSAKQVATLQAELTQTRSSAEADKNDLIVEVDGVKARIRTMEENFMLWRTKVHKDQITQQEEYLNERLVKQDCVEELEEKLETSQEEVARLRKRLLVLEYEDGYKGPTSFINDELSLVAEPEHGPMTVASHKRRSNDFNILELKARNCDKRIQELDRALEMERQEHQKDLVDFRMRMHAKVAKLEEEVQAAKMESSIYTEMMHEIVTENDTLRSKIKQTKRMSRRREDGSSLSFGSNNYSHDYYSDLSGDSIQRVGAFDARHKDLNTIANLTQPENMNLDDNNIYDYDGGNNDNNDDDGNDIINHEIDIEYVAESLREMGISWENRAAFATHHLVILQDPSYATNCVTNNNSNNNNNNSSSSSSNSTTPSTENEFQVLSQFLMSGSAVFRDFMALGPQTHQQQLLSLSQNQEPVDEQRQRLSCFRYGNFLIDQQTTTTQEQSQQQQQQQQQNRPVLELFVPYPEHIQSLLEVMYDMDLDRWATTTFTPATIGPITANVARLECCTDITLRCLEYYHLIRSTPSIHVASQSSSICSSSSSYLESGAGDRHELERLYQLAVTNGLLF
ncbi:hypothetical protein BG004_001244 [Podila humilis]|nr:hypothetical protein BG004_001244 [Podila humilis]